MRPTLTAFNTTRFALCLSLCALIWLTVAYYFERAALAEEAGKNMALNRVITEWGADAAAQAQENADLHSRVKSLRIYSRTVREENAHLKARIAELERRSK